MANSETVDKEVERIMGVISSMAREAVDVAMGPTTPGVNAWVPIKDSIPREYECINGIEMPFEARYATERARLT